MLNPEQAAAGLRAFAVEEWKERRVRDLFALPRDLRTPGMALLERDDKGKRVEDPETAGACLREAMENLDGLVPCQRLQVFNALFPRIGQYVEEAWQLWKRLPYQYGWASRRPFRAPHTPRTTLPARQIWLASLLGIAGSYEQDICWFAAWAPYIRWNAPAVLGPLLAAAIDTGGPEGEEVFQILCASARGEHEIGAMGRHVTRALLTASRPDGWEFVEQLLLAAQRQEGLRQVILETVDEAHPQAFCRMLRLILEHHLTRFSATVRAVNVWFGFAWDVSQPRAINGVLEQTLYLLETPRALLDGLDGDGNAVYLALWTMAFQDAVATLEPASRLSNDSDVERRFAATYLLTQLGLVGSQRALLPLLEDPDLRIVTCALNGLQPVDESLRESDLFERLETVLHRFPRRKKALTPIIWPWCTLSADPSTVASVLISALGNRSPARLIPHLPVMAVSERIRVAQLLTSVSRRNADARAACLSLLGDPSPHVREQALKALETQNISPQESPYLESLLTRTAGDLRRGVLSLLFRQEDDAVLVSAERLLASSHPQQRQAGLELLRQMVEAGRRVEECQALAAQYGGKPSQPAEEEQRLIHLVLQGQAPPTLENALGLMDPSCRTRPSPPRIPTSPFIRRDSLVTPAAIACMKALDDLVHQHATAIVSIKKADGRQEEVLLGNLTWEFPHPEPTVPPDEDRAHLPLHEVWETWWQTRPTTLRDTDGLELVRALAPLVAWFWPLDRSAPQWLQKAWRRLLGDQSPQQTLRYPLLVKEILIWLLRLHPPAGATDFLLDAVELTFALIPKEELARSGDSYENREWRQNYGLLAWLELARLYRRLRPDQWENVHHVRLWRLLRWMDEPGTAVPRRRPYLEEVLEAFCAGGATEADVLDYLLGPRQETPYGFYGFGDLWSLSGRKPGPLLLKYPFLQGIIARCRERIIEVELQRGDLPTAASRPALSLRYAGGMDTLMRLLHALGTAHLSRTSRDVSRIAVLSHLIRVTFPSETDTPEDFALRIRSLRLTQRQLAELALHAPQWAACVERALEWPGLAEAVWWIYAHTRDQHWRVPPEIREGWQVQISAYTPLSGEELLDGAVDVGWFYRAYHMLGQERWDLLYAAAKYASGGQGHRRAQMFADALLGRIDVPALAKRMMEKRDRNAVLALGLLPLAEDRERDLLERYRLLQEFLRTGRKFGAQRRVGEERAVSLAMQNLARTAGYTDPLRLQWAMEMQEIADLAQGPKTVQVGEITVSLKIGPLGDPHLTVTKAGKGLREIPARVKKDPQVAELRGRKREIERQASRMRLSLEQAMCRGDTFTGAELMKLLAHPVPFPMLKNLVFVQAGFGEESTEKFSAGYPIRDEWALRCADGQKIPVAADDLLRIAHPYDLFLSGEWVQWQRECFLTERVQPFKQVFRELYLLTSQEKTDGILSRRYAGHQVQPRQALALLGQRGWVYSSEDGGARRTFHDHHISAWVFFAQGAFTPAEVEGLTIDIIQFTPHNEWKPLHLAQIPPRLFSEVMRDLDLVVSVAHMGGVDPEATASTMEMRAALIRETCAMLHLTNVQIQRPYVLIQGELGRYSIHLGSGTVHRQPGGVICIIPVHSQHRGRLFLPFVDDDPKTAEVLSKVLLLARDTEITDPTILEQLIR